MEHRAPPDHRLLVLHEHADGDHLHVVRHRRHDHSVELGGDVVHPQHAGDGEAVDVSVHHTDAQSLGGHGRSQVGRHRGLPDPALAGGHRVDTSEVARLGEGDLRLRLPTAQVAAQGGTLLVVHDSHAHLHVGNALQRADLLAGVGRDRVLERTAGDGQQDADGDHALRADVNGLHHAEIGDGLTDLRVDDASERLAHLVLCRDGRHGPILCTRQRAPIVVRST